MALIQMWGIVIIFGDAYNCSLYNSASMVRISSFKQLYCMC